MNKFEISQLLTLASGHDRFIQVDDVTATAWAMTPGMPDIEQPAARDAVLTFYSTWDGRTPLTAAYLLKATNTATPKTTEAIAADVRSARARQLVPADWSEKERIPADAQAKLDAARAENNRWLELNPWALA